jgi:hypothetical protein
MIRFSGLASPANQTPFRGGSATFRVSAASPSPIHYQWWFNGADLPGATNQSLLLNEFTTPMPDYTR